MAHFDARILHSSVMTFWAPRGDFFKSAGLLNPALWTKLWIAYDYYIPPTMESYPTIQWLFWLWVTDSAVLSMFWLLSSAPHLLLDFIVVIVIVADRELRGIAIISSYWNSSLSIWNYSYIIGLLLYVYAESLCNIIINTHRY